MFIVKKLVLIIVLLLLAAGGRSAQAAGALLPPASLDQQDAVAAAADWLVRTHQNEDGGYASFSGGAGAAPSDIAGTLDAIIAISSAGYPVDLPYPGLSATPLDFIGSDPDALAEYAATNGGSAGRLLLALAAADQNPRAFLGQDFVAIALAHADESGSLAAATPYEQALALLGLAAAGEPAPAAALDWLIGLQAGDGDLAGSWDDGFGTPGNADATGMAIMALQAHGLGAADPAIAAALAFLQATRQPAGWEYGAGFGANVSSTAIVVGALSALGEDFYSAEGAWALDGSPPLAALLAYQDESGGFTVDFGDGPFADFYATVQALPAAAGRFLPLPNRMAAAAAAVSCLATLEDPAGGWASFAGGAPDAGGTARAIQATQAVANHLRSPGWATPAAALDTLAAQAPDYLADARGGRAAGLILAVVAAGGDPRDFAGVDLVAFIADSMDAGGAYDDTSFGIFAHSRAMQGLLVAGVAPPPPAIDLLLGSGPAGDWGSPDSNGLALHVLALLGHNNPPTVAALRSTQLADGGWGFDESSNPSATSEVVQGLVAAGYNPYGPSWQQRVDGRLSSPADAVLATQAADGCWPNLFGEGADPYSTVDAVLLLAAFPYSWDEPETGVVEVMPEPVVVPEATATAEPEAAATATSAPVEVEETSAGGDDAAPPEPTEAPAATAVPDTPEAGGSANLTGWLIAIVVVVGAGGVLIWRRRQ